VPAFQLLLGGNARGEGRIAKLTMKMPARYIPDAVEKLVDAYVGGRDEGEKFGDWSGRVGTVYVQELLADYKIVPEFTQDPMAYVDWGQTKLFTLDDMGEGECAV
jgi:sulfite reductase beta subunit-like hemoprotein